jgi:hypothetical protein
VRHFHRRAAVLKGRCFQAGDADLHFPRNLALDVTQYTSENRNQEKSKTMNFNRKGNSKMKTYLVYDLDSRIPVAVGEQISAETARYCASEATGIFPANLLAEEIDLEQQVTY